MNVVICARPAKIVKRAFLGYLLFLIFQPEASLQPATVTISSAQPPIITLNTNVQQTAKGPLWVLIIPIEFLLIAWRYLFSLTQLLPRHREDVKPTDDE